MLSLTAGQSFAHTTCQQEENQARPRAPGSPVDSNTAQCTTVQHNKVYSAHYAQFFLLGGEVKVESGLEAVELELTGREESAGSLRRGGSGQEGGQGRRLLGLRKAGAGLLTSEETGLLVRGVKGVDEGVDAGAVGAGRHNGAVKLLVVDSLLLGGSKAGGVGVELEVAVSRVVGVDEGVEVGVDGGGDIVALVNVVIVLGSGGSDGDRGGDLPHGGLLLLGDIGGRVEPVGAGGNVRTVQNPEAVLSGGVLHGVGLAVVADVAVLADTLALGAGLLSKDDAVLLGVGRPETAVAGVETLLLEDLGVLGVDKLTGCGRGQARCENLETKL